MEQQSQPSAFSTVEEFACRLKNQSDPLVVVEELRTHWPNADRPFVTAVDAHCFARVPGTFYLRTTCAFRGGTVRGALVVRVERESKWVELWLQVRDASAFVPVQLPLLGRVGTLGVRVPWNGGPAGLALVYEDASAWPVGHSWRVSRVVLSGQVPSLQRWERAVVHGRAQLERCGSLQCRVGVALTIDTAASSWKLAATVQVGELAVLLKESATGSCVDRLAPKRTLYCALYVEVDKSKPSSLGVGGGELGLRLLRVRLGAGSIGKLVATAAGEEVAARTSEWLSSPHAEHEGARWPIGVLADFSTASEVDSLREAKWPAEGFFVDLEASSHESFVRVCGGLQLHDVTLLVGLTLERKDALSGGVFAQLKVVNVTGSIGTALRLLRKHADALLDENARKDPPESASGVLDGKLNNGGTLTVDFWFLKAAELQWGFAFDLSDVDLVLGKCTLRLEYLTVLYGHQSEATRALVQRSKPVHVASLHTAVPAMSKDLELQRAENDASGLRIHAKAVVDVGSLLRIEAQCFVVPASHLSASVTALLKLDQSDNGVISTASVEGRLALQWHPRVEGELDAALRLKFAASVYRVLPQEFEGALALTWSDSAPLECILSGRMRNWSPWQFARGSTFQDFLPTWTVRELAVSVWIGGATAGQFEVEAEIQLRNDKQTRDEVNVSYQNRVLWLEKNDASELPAAGVTLTDAHAAQFPHVADFVRANVGHVVVRGQHYLAARPAAAGAYAIDPLRIAQAEALNAPSEAGVWKIKVRFFPNPVPLLGLSLDLCIHRLVLRDVFALLPGLSAFSTPEFALLDKVFGVRNFQLFFPSMAAELTQLAASGRAAVDAFRRNGGTGLWTGLSAAKAELSKGVQALDSRSRRQLNGLMARVMAGQPLARLWIDEIWVGRLTDQRCFLYGQHIEAFVIVSRGLVGFGVSFNFASTALKPVLVGALAGHLIVQAGTQGRSMFSLRFDGALQFLFVARVEVNAGLCLAAQGRSGFWLRVHFHVLVVLQVEAYIILLGDQAHLKLGIELLRMADVGVAEEFHPWSLEEVTTGQPQPASSALGAGSHEALKRQLQETITLERNSVLTFLRSLWEQMKRWAADFSLAAFEAKGSAHWVECYIQLSLKVVLAGATFETSWRYSWKDDKSMRDPRDVNQNEHALQQFIRNAVWTDVKNNSGLTEAELAESRRAYDGPPQPQLDEFVSRMWEKLDLGLEEIVGPWSSCEAMLKLATQRLSLTCRKHRVRCRVVTLEVGRPKARRSVRLQEAIFDEMAILEASLSAWRALQDEARFAVEPWTDLVCTVRVTELVGWEDSLCAELAEAVLGNQSSVKESLVQWVRIVDTIRCGL